MRKAIPLMTNFYLCYDSKFKRTYTSGLLVSFEHLYLVSTKSAPRFTRIYSNYRRGVQTCMTMMRIQESLQSSNSENRLSCHVRIKSPFIKFYNNACNICLAAINSSGSRIAIRQPIRSRLLYWNIYRKWKYYIFKNQSRTMHSYNIRHWPTSHT